MAGGHPPSKTAVLDEGIQKAVIESGNIFSKAMA